MAPVGDIIVQGSPEWLEYRRTRGGASEAAALLGCSPWYPKTPADLYDLKTGATTKYVSAAMQRGNDLEAIARAYVERVYGEPFIPAMKSCAGHPRIIASLDGINFDGDVIIEIKAPAKGKDSDLWSFVSRNTVPPDYYWWQVQQQLLCSGARHAIFAVYQPAVGDPIPGLSVEESAITAIVTPDTDAHKRIIEVWADFFAALDSGTRPESDDEPVARDDDEWQEAAQAWQASKLALDVATAAEKAARAALLELCGNQSAIGGGVKAVRHWVSGGIDYKAATTGVDLAPFEKSGRWQYRLTTLAGGTP